jgi:hypothetical protein
MNKSIKRSKKNQTNTLHVITLFLLFLLFVTVITMLPSLQTKKVSNGQSLTDSAIPFTPEPAKSSLQLQWFLFPSPTPAPPITPVNNTTQPTPSPVPLLPPASNPQTPNPSTCGIGVTNCGSGSCVDDGPVNDASECCPGVPTCQQINDNPAAYPNVFCNLESVRGIGANKWCDAKPVIYLYPKHDTTITVSLQVPGTIPVSDPLYPQGGWQNIHAYPNGSFNYQGEIYHELFYEATITPITPPDTGVIVPVANLKQKLISITHQLGLNQSEQKEFLEYWLPRLTTLNTPYIAVSVFNPDQKESIDKVTISPKPDTFIQFIMYFKGLEQPVLLQPLQLPLAIPQRIGFTAVEWGGIIDE